MQLIRNNKTIFFTDADIQSLKSILDYYTWNVLDNWEGNLNDLSVVDRLNDFLRN